VSDDITSVPTDLFSGVIDPNLCAKTFHLSLETEGNISLFAGETVDLDELNKEVLQSVLIDQKETSKPDLRVEAQKTKNTSSSFAA